MPQKAALDVIAVTGVCVAARRSHALRLARERGFIFVPAEQAGQGVEAVDRMIALARGAFDPPGVILEYPAEVTAAEIVGALTTSGARLLEMVCVLDVGHLLEDLDSDLLIEGNGGGACADHPRRAEVLVSQIELSSTVVLVNSESLHPDETEQMAALVSHLAPSAHLFHSGRPPAVQQDVHGSFGSEPPSAGWVALLNREFSPRFHAPGITACRYEQCRPFHPGRLWQGLTELMSEGACGRVLRSAGFARLATRPHITALWDHVGRTFSLTSLADDQSLSAQDELLAFGQDLAFFGIGLDQSAVTRVLDSAVLSDGELEVGPMTWATFPDPFPVWDTVGR